MLVILKDDLFDRKATLVDRKDAVYNGRMSRRYDQYCPIAHALDLVGERWSLLVVRELLHGPLRYTDLAARLHGCSTNMLAARLRALEEGGIVERHRLPPPAAAQVYRLTEYGERLRPVMQALALWGARSLGPPTAEHSPDPGWLVGALDVGIGALAPPGSFEFRVADEVASLVHGRGYEGPAEEPDVVVTTDPAGFYHLFVTGCDDGVDVEGDRELLERLVATVVPQTAPVPA
jgi:DNA-binding HxlR family transcriptional regulator